MKYTEKQLIEFANYVLSLKGQKTKIKSSVSDADLANWKHDKKNVQP